ncbi:hypothetical protein P3S67_014893 [Capsicum chacoense]
MDLVVFFLKQKYRRIGPSCKGHSRLCVILRTSLSRYKFLFLLLPQFIRLSRVGYIWIPLEGGLLCGCTGYLGINVWK